MRIFYGCPSWKKCDKPVKTLRYMTGCKVFVDGGQYEEYCRRNDPESIVRCPDGVQGNLCRVRNYMIDYAFRAGYDAIVIVDDDLAGIGRYERDGLFGYRKHNVGWEELQILCEKYFEVCSELGFRQWGMQCNSDAMAFRQYTPFSFVSYLGGPFQAFLNNELRYDERLPLKEDYDMTLQQCNKYRGVLRVNYMFYECDQSNSTGGCADYRTMRREQEQFEMLRKKWGSQIVKQDKSAKKQFDYNPIITVPIKGV